MSPINKDHCTALHCTAQFRRGPSPHGSALHCPCRLSPVPEILLQGPHRKIVPCPTMAMCPCASLGCATQHSTTLSWSRRVYQPYQPCNHVAKLYANQALVDQATNKQPNAMKLGTGAIRFDRHWRELVIPPNRLVEAFVAVGRFA